MNRHGESCECERCSGVPQPRARDGYAMPVGYRPTPIDPMPYTIEVHASGHSQRVRCALCAFVGSWVDTTRAADTAGRMHHAASHKEVPVATTAQRMARPALQIVSTATRKAS